VKGGVDVTREPEEITYRSDPEIFVDAKKALEDGPSIPPEVHVHVSTATSR
jgi:hypothetical protein